MGTWGPKNLNSDGALDVISDDSHRLVSEIVELAKSERASQYDEYDYDLLFVRFEQLFALNAAGLIQSWPASADLVGLKDSYLARWREYLEQPWKERETEIAATFDRFVALCKTEEERVTNLPPLNVFEPPSTEEVLGDLTMQPVTLLNDYQVDVPSAWQVHESTSETDLPVGSVLGELIEHCGLRFDMTAHEAGIWQLELQRVAVASGVSLERDTVPPGYDPYLLLGLLRGEPDDAADRYTLCFATEAQLANRYAEQGEYLAGASIGLDLKLELDFLGCQSFRHVGEVGGIRMERELFFCKLSNTEVLVLEIGGCQDNSDERKDQWLVSGLAQTLRRATD